MIPVYGSASVGKVGRGDKNLEMLIHELAEYGLRGELVFADDEIMATFSSEVSLHSELE